MLSCVVAVSVAAPPGASLVRSQQQIPSFRSSVNTVSIYATVQDPKGRLVPDLQKTDFEVRDNGVPVELTVFSNELQPFTAVLALDMSYSMAKQYGRVVDAARSFVGAMYENDRVRIASFGREVAVSPLLTADKTRLLHILDSELWPGGSTPLWRASTLAMDSLASEKGRRVVFVVTDGNDSGRDYNCAPLVSDPRGTIGPCPAQRDVRNRAETDEFMFYVVGIGGTGLDASIRDIASRTGGGQFQLGRDDDLQATFTRVADELHHQYVLGFSPATLDGRPHELSVSAKRPGLVVRARKTYVAKGSK
jgi:VWFA-related protein